MRKEWVRLASGFCSFEGECVVRGSRTINDERGGPHGEEMKQVM
jgi:hypothetical protein